MDFNNYCFSKLDDFVLDIKTEDMLSDVIIEVSEVQVNGNISEFETICNDEVNSEKSVIEECVEDKPRIKQYFEHILTDVATEICQVETEENIPNEVNLENSVIVENIKPQIKYYFEHFVTDAAAEISRLETKENNLKEKIRDLIKLSDKKAINDTFLPEQINETEVPNSKLKKKMFKYTIFDVKDPSLSNSELSNKINNDLNSSYEDIIQEDSEITRGIFPKKKSVENSLSTVLESPMDSEEKMDSTLFETGYYSPESDSFIQPTPFKAIPNTSNNSANNNFYGFDNSANNFYGFDNGQGTSGIQNIKRGRCDSNIDVSIKDNFGSTENLPLEMNQENKELSEETDFYINKHKIKEEFGNTQNVPLKIGQANRESSQKTDLFIKKHKKLKITKRNQEKADMLFARQLHRKINRYHLSRNSLKENIPNDKVNLKNSVIIEKCVAPMKPQIKQCFQHILTDVATEISQVETEENIPNDEVNLENSVIVKKCIEDIKPGTSQYFKHIVTDVATEISQKKTDENNLKEKICDQNKLKKKMFKYTIFDVKEPSLSNSELSNKINNEWNSFRIHEDLIQDDFEITRVIFPKKKSVGKSFSTELESPVDSEEKKDSTSTCFETGYYTSKSNSSIQPRPFKATPNTVKSQNNNFYGFDNGQGTSGIQNIKRQHCDSKIDVSIKDDFGSTENVPLETSRENRELSQKNDYYIKEHKKSKITKRNQEKADLLFARQLHGTINRQHLKRSRSPNCNSFK